MQNTKDAITAKVREIVDALPQREAILESDARFWIAEVVERYNELAIWHATRAGGFGGSQIGALVRNHCGQRADHEQSAHDIVAGALLRKLPDEPNGHMRRGIAMEPHHRRWFYEKHCAVRDVVGFTTLSKGTGPAPWMRYSPDDLVFMPDPQQPNKKTRRLIDFKAPSQVDQGERISFQYVCQLHMGRTVCEHNGVRVDGLLLSQFDWANWQLKDDEVPHVADLDGMILAAGDYYWDFVLRGELPPYVFKQRLDPTAVATEVRDAAARLARLKAVASALDKRIKDLDVQVKEPLAQMRFGGDRLVLDGITFSSTPKFDGDKLREAVPEELLATVPLQARATKRYDEEEMLRALRAAGLDTKKFLKPSNLDPEALYSVLCDAGYDADGFMGEELRGTVDKKLTEEAVQRVEREYADLIFTASERDQADEAPQDGRVGQQTSSYVPRPVVA